MTPTARSLAYCRQQGYQAAVVERWIPQARKRVDAFGWIDLLILTGESIAGVQCTSGDNHASRVAKVRELAGPWIACGGVAEVWSWSKQGPRGARKLWRLRREEIR